MTKPRVRWQRAWPLLAAAAAALVLRRRRAPASAPPAAVPLAPPPRGATPGNEQTIDRLIERETRRTLADFWLELTILAVIALLVAAGTLMTRRNALVLVRDLHQGDRIELGDVKAVPLPQLEHAFSDALQVKDLLAVRDLQRGSVLRTSDVARPQAVTTVNIAAGELLDPAKNVAFKLLPYVGDAITPGPPLRKQAAQFIPAGAGIRGDAVVDVKAAPAAGEVEVPLRAFTGAIAPAAASEVTIVATPRGGGTGTVFEHVRVVSVDRGREPATLLVIMTKPEAMRLAALPTADFTLMRGR